MSGHQDWAWQPKVTITFKLCQSLLQIAREWWMFYIKLCASSWHGNIERTLFTSSHKRASKCVLKHYLHAWNWHQPVEVVLFKQLIRKKTLHLEKLFTTYLAESISIYQIRNIHVKQLSWSDSITIIRPWFRPRF